MAEIKYDTSVISTVINCAESMGGAYQEMINLLNDAYKKANELQLVYDKIFEKYNEIKAELDNINNEYNNLNEELDVISFGIYYEDIDYKNDTKEEIARKEAYNAQARIEEEEERQRINNSINELLTKIQEMQEILNNAQQELNKAKEELNNAKEKAESFYKTVKEFNEYLLYINDEINADIDSLNQLNAKTEANYFNSDYIIFDQHIIASNNALNFFYQYGSVKQDGLEYLFSSLPPILLFEPSNDNEITEIISQLPIIEIVNDTNIKIEMYNSKIDDELKKLSKFVEDKYGMDENDAFITMRSLDLQGACTYADTCNIIYQLYDFDNEKFEKDFGYPMINKDNTLNGNQLLLDLYIYQNIGDIGDQSELFIKNSNGRISLNNKYLLEHEYTNETYFDASKQNYMASPKKISDENGNQHADYFREEKLMGFLRDNNSCYKDGTFSTSTFALINEYENEKVINHYFSDLNEINQQSFQEVLINAINNNKMISTGQTKLYTLNNENECSQPSVRGHATTMVGLTENGILVQSYGKTHYVPFDETDICTFEIIEYIPPEHTN